MGALEVIAPDEFQQKPITDISFGEATGIIIGDTVSLGGPKLAVEVLAAWFDTALAVREQHHIEAGTSIADMLSIESTEPSDFEIVTDDGDRYKWSR